MLETNFGRMGQSVDHPFPLIHWRNTGRHGSRSKSQRVEVAFPGDPGGWLRNGWFVFSSQMMSDVRSSTEVAITLGCSQATVIMNHHWDESSWCDQEMLESATKRLERTFRKRDDGSFLEEALRVKRRILGWRCIRCVFICMKFGSFPWNLQDVFGFWGLFHRIWLELCPMRFRLDLIQVTIYNDWL
jgi:hypothetical protein